MGVSVQRVRARLRCFRRWLLAAGREGIERFCGKIAIPTPVQVCCNGSPDGLFVVLCPLSSGFPIPRNVLISPAYSDPTGGLKDCALHAYVAYGLPLLNDEGGRESVFTYRYHPTLCSASQVNFKKVRC